VNKDEYRRQLCYTTTYGLVNRLHAPVGYCRIRLSFLRDEQEVPLGEEHSASVVLSWCTL